MYHSNPYTQPHYNELDHSDIHEVRAKESAP
jgi:uncharacterized membrane protein YfcA